MDVSRRDKDVPPSLNVSASMLNGAIDDTHQTPDLVAVNHRLVMDASLDGSFGLFDVVVQSFTFRSRYAP